MKRKLSTCEVISTIASVRDKPGKTADEQIVERTLEKAIHAGGIEPGAAIEIVKHAHPEPYEPDESLAARFRKFFAPRLRTKSSSPSPSW